MNSEEMVGYLHFLPGYLDFVECPQCKELDFIKYGVATVRVIGTMHWAVIHLNDEHKWSRDQIADWLESLPEDEYDLSFKEKDVTTEDSSW